MRVLINIFMEYWKNPTVEIAWPSEIDVFAEHSKTHCLFYNPAARVDSLITTQKLSDLCRWAQEWLTQDGLDGLIAEPRCHYDVANLVKINIWLHDIRQQGNVKPWLLQDQGDGTLQAGNGDTRLKCLERIPEITTVHAFVSTRRERASFYADLEPVTTFNQFAGLCGAEYVGQPFLIRFTDESAPYGIDWYEYASTRTRAVTPNQDQAVDMFVQYMRANPNTEITPEWFDCKIDWNRYGSNQ
jgi:hypothetical protein